MLHITGLLITDQLKTTFEVDHLVFQKKSSTLANQKKLGTSYSETAYLFHRLVVSCFSLSRITSPGVAVCPKDQQ